MTRRDGAEEVVSEQAHVAAMEPAEDRLGEDGKPVQTTPPNMPQWSQPRIDWMTGQLTGRQERLEEAAMEPANELAG
jgi:hypothetical protein